MKPVNIYQSAVLIPILLVFMGCSAMLASVQPQKPIELEKRLEYASEKEKIWLLIELASYYENRAPGKVLHYAGKALEICRRLNDPRGAAYASLYLCGAWSRKGDYKKALPFGLDAVNFARTRYGKSGNKTENALFYITALTDTGLILIRTGRDADGMKFYDEAATVARSPGQTEKIHRVFIQSASYYYQRGDFNLAVSFALKAIQLGRKAQKKHLEGIALSHLATLYSDQDNREKAVKYYTDALKLMETANYRPGIAQALSGLGTVYTRTGQYNRALNCFGRALQVFRKLNTHEKVASTLLNLGTIHARLNQSAKAESYYLESKNIYDTLETQPGKARLYTAMGSLYMELGNDKKAVLLLQDALNIAKRKKFLAILRDVYFLLFKMTEKLKDYRTALLFHSSYRNYDIILFNNKSRRKIQEMQIRFETEEKINEMDELEKEKTIRALRVKNEILLRNTVFGGFVVLIVLGVLLFRKYIYLLAFWKREKYMGQYRLAEKIGGGAMGMVFKARHIEDRFSLAAVKILKSELFSNDSARKRFQREALIINSLRHPNIVEIYERGEYKNRLYIAMEFVPGKTLEKLIIECGPMKISRFFTVMEQLTGALAYIHGRQIIHRDLKPANIMVIEKDGMIDNVKLLDFGLAKMKFQTKLTCSGNFLGSFEYLSPEQILDTQTTPLSDIFALGVTAYRMLSGRLPFSGENAVDVLRRIVRFEPPQITESRPDIPEELNDLVMLMLSKEAGFRPTAPQVLDRLRQFKHQD